MTEHLDTIRALLEANRTESNTQHRILTPEQVSALGRVLADAGHDAPVAEPDGPTDTPLPWRKGKLGCIVSDAPGQHHTDLDMPEHWFLRAYGGYPVTEDIAERDLDYIIDAMERATEEAKHYTVVGYCEDKIERPFVLTVKAAGEWDAIVEVFITQTDDLDGEDIQIIDVFHRGRPCGITESVASLYDLWVLATKETEPMEDAA